MHLKSFARELRKNLTDAEQTIWSKIRRQQLGYRFYRQRPIGPYIVDFFCPLHRLVIELDGGQHYAEVGQANDATRDQYLRSLRLTILRFSNRDVMENLDGVITTILNNFTSPNLP